MDETRRHPLSDSLDREIEMAVAIEPSPEFLARVRTRIAADPAVDVESGFSWIRRLSFEPLAGVAIAGIVLAVVVPQFTREEAARPQVMRSPVVDVAVPAVEDHTLLRAARGSVRRAPRTGVQRAESAPAAVGQVDPRTLPLQLSPVLFSEEDRRSFAWFAAAVANGTVSAEAVQALGEEDMTSLAIAPLVIDPLPPLARVERKGEGQW